MPNVDPIGGIILAAGNSLRFGGDKRFEVMPEGKTLLEETIRSAMTCIARILVVLRKDDEFGDRLNGFVNDRYLRFFCAPDSDQGMGSSLANSISELENWQAALVILGDMPYIKQETYENAHCRLPNRQQSHYCSRLPGQNRPPRIVRSLLLPRTRKNLRRPGRKIHNRSKPATHHQRRSRRPRHSAGYRQA